MGQRHSKKFKRLDPFKFNSDHWPQCSHRWCDTDHTSTSSGGTLRKPDGQGRPVRDGGAHQVPLRHTVENMSDTVVMVLPNSRELAWLEVGDPEGPAVFVFHGTPGSRLRVSFNEEPINAAGVRFIAVDRPGYGHSSYQQGRRLADWASDVSCLADHLNIDKFSVVGISGGGPHAAVCARFLADRVLGAGIVSGVGPLAEPRTEDGMMGFNKLIVRLARRSQYLVYPPFALSASVFRRWPEKALRAGSGQLPSSDMEVLSRPKVQSAFIEDYHIDDEECGIRPVLECGHSSPLCHPGLGPVPGEIYPASDTGALMFSHKNARMCRVSSVCSSTTVHQGRSYRFGGMSEPALLTPVYLFRHPATMTA
jgi:hypothetical protein